MGLRAKILCKFCPPSYPFPAPDNYLYDYYAIVVIFPNPTNIQNLDLFLEKLLRIVEWVVKGCAISAIKTKLN